MAEEKKIEDPVLHFDMKKSEVFQLYLSIISRTGYAQQKWASASSEEEQKHLQQEIALLAMLTKKFSDLLK